MNHAALIRMIHSRSCLFMAVIIAVLCGVGAYLFVPDNADIASQGFVVGWTTALPLPREVLFALAALVTGGIVVLQLYINKVYNLLHHVTRLQGSVFLLMQIATPLMLYAFCPGILTALVVMWCILLMYSIYGEVPCDTRKVFTVFALLSVCSSFDYTYVVYVPVFVFSCFQLRVFSLRTALAILIGIATPWIIFFGFGIVTVDDLQLPYTGPNWHTDGNLSSSLLMGVAVFTGFVLLMALVSNMVKYIAYNARMRSMIGVITVISLVTMLAAAFDTEHLYNYLALINVCAAFQVSHLFSAVYNFGKAYIGVIALAVIYLILYGLNFVV